ncbi:beta-ketoacyl synthase N-terminal-like domain-containing protein [Lentzea xinjiangensis]|nr:beta-ketoacyl synthase N-terminal-like domain-containing protein [Lentzea xinjiangensis]
MAWTTPLGTGLDDVWAVLLAGGCGVRPVPSRHALRTTAAAMVAAPPAPDPPAERQITLTASTLESAFAHAGLTVGDPRVMVVLGSSYAGNLDGAEGTVDSWATSAVERLGHPNPPVTVATACSAGSDALLIGAELIRAGICDMCVCGGADVVTPAKRLGHSALGTMSTGELRAFDQHRDGMVLGEGAAFVVLESESSAAARSATVHARLAGAGSANDASGLTSPDESGDSIVLAVDRALRGSGLTPADIAVVSAHGSGTSMNDTTEATALSRIFTGLPPGPLVFGTKGALGHSLGATGAIEAITVILALREGVVPPVLGLAEPIAVLVPEVAAGAARPFRGAAGVSLTLGFGGFNTCLVFTGTP